MTVGLEWGVHTSWLAKNQGKETHMVLPNPKGEVPQPHSLCTTAWTRFWAKTWSSYTETHWSAWGVIWMELWWPLSCLHAGWHQKTVKKDFGTQEDHIGPIGFQNLQITRGSSKREGYSSRRLTLRDDFSWRTQILVPVKGSAEVAQHAFRVDVVTTPSWLLRKLKHRGLQRSSPEPLEWAHWLQHPRLPEKKPQGVSNSENSHKGNHLNTRLGITQPPEAPCAGCLI